MTREIPSASLWENVLYNLIHVIPAYLQGLFTRKKLWVSFWAKVHPDPLAVRFFTHLRKKYQSDYLYLRVLTTKSLVVLDEQGIRRALDHSPALYAEARLKRDGMSHFQPHALTISRGEAWKKRRRFNEAVLYGEDGLHPYAGHFLKVIRREVAALQPESEGVFTWDPFETLFERISMQIIFGEQARGDTDLMRLLKEMMRESNRVIGLKKSRHFDPFYERIHAYLQAPPENSLVALCRQVPSTEETRVENQIPHWMFAMNETLATNTVRALALIAAHPEAETRVRDEVAAANLSSPEEVNGLRYLEGCVQEAMRLWPTTPMLVRETVEADTLGGNRIPPETQVVIPNSFNHRDREKHPQADTFSPERWLDGGVDYHFNHLSNGLQVCAGKDLALLIAKGVLAAMLSRARYTLLKPTLDLSRPLPYAFDNYRVRFSVEPLYAARPS